LLYAQSKVTELAVHLISRNPDAAKKRFRITMFSRITS